MKKTLLICLSVLMIALVGCKKETNTWGMLKEGSVTVQVGKTVQLTFTNNGNTHPQWSVDDDFYASVDNNGLVTGMHVGQCVVSVNGLQCTVYVTDEYEGEIYEPWQESWATVYEDPTDMIELYESLVRGDDGLMEVEYDSIEIFDVKVIQDTNWITTDSFTVDVRLDSTSLGFEKVVVGIDFEYSSFGGVVEKVSYVFSIEELTGAEDRTYGSMLEECSMTSIDNIQALETFIANRYPKDEDGVYYYYWRADGKTCDITQEDYTFTYKANR